MSEPDLYVSALSDLCSSVKGGLDEVANAAGVSAANLRQILARTKLPSGNERGVGPALRKRLTEAYPLWLSKTFPDNPYTVAIPGDGYLIRQYETGGSMGYGLVLREQPGVIESWNVSEDWVRKNLPYYTSVGNLAIVTGFGDSMLGLFNPGDPLLVDTGIQKADVDGVYFFRVGDEGFIKRLQRIPGEGILVISENQKYRDWTIKNDMDFQVFAKVLKAWKGENL